MATNNIINTPLIALGGAFTMTGGAFTFTGTLTGNTAVTFPTSGTLITTIGGVLPLNQGGTNAALIAANGGIVYSNSTQLAILAPTATANQVLLSGSSTTPLWSTATYPVTTTLSQLLYSSTSNVISGLATAINGTLVTGATGIPSILVGPGTSGQVLQSNAAAAPSFSTASYPSTTTINRILYSSSANVVDQIVTGNSGVLITSAGGIPSISSTIPAATQANITTVGTITSGTWNGSIVAGQYGGTGIANTGKTITLGGSLTTTGAFSPTLAFSASNTYTFPSATQTILGLLGGSLSGSLYLVNSTPATSLEAASKGYVDSVASGFHIITAAVAGTTANRTSIYANGAAGVGATLTNSGAMAAFSTDGISPSVNDRVLVKSQTAPAENGVYTLTTVGSGVANWVLTRATDYDTSVEVLPGTIVPVTSGTTLAASTWLQYDTVATMGTDPIQFSQYSVSNPVTLASGGTSANLTASAGAVVYSTASAMGFTAVGSSGQLLSSAGTGTPIWTTSTYPASAGTVGKIIISDGTNFVSSTPAYPNASVTSGKFIISDGTNYIASTSIMPNTVGTALHILISDGTVNTYSTPAYPNASVTAGKLIISDGTNYIASTSIFPNTVGAAGKIIISDGTINTYSTPTYPNASVTAGKFIISDGTNYIASTSIMPNTVGTVGKIIRSDGTVNAYTTSTFADTYTANSILYASSANVVVGLTTAASSILSTSAGGVPTWLSIVTVPNGGTGAATFTANAVICGGTVSTGALQSVASVGTAGQVLTSNGAGSLPTFQSSGLGSGAFNSIVTQIFVANGTYTPTAGMKYCIIECVGGGGAGGSLASSLTIVGVGGGGGAGSYSRKIAASGTIGVSQTVTIGIAGIPGAAGNNPGGNGGDTSLGAICIAKGGSGGDGDDGTSGNSSPGGVGGIAGTGDLTIPGTPGFIGVNSTSLGATGWHGGEGGNSFYGAGAPAKYSNGDGNPASNYGSGGGGAWTLAGIDRSGGAGSAGIIAITEYISV